MKRTALLVASLGIFVIKANAQNPLTGKEIYRVNCKAIVQIKTSEEMGVGFIISSDGLIMTANHVVTTRDSQHREYAGEINVFVDREQMPYKAKPLVQKISDDQVNYDSALIKIPTKGLPYVALGSSDEVDVGDNLILTPTWPDTGCIMLQGTVSGKIRWIIPDLGPKPINTILFQSPVRNGFSGTPIFSSTGHVIGVQTTKIFGISLALDNLRTRWMGTKTGKTTGGVIVSQRYAGIDLADSFLELINNLDQNLISGLGSAVAIEYAKEQQQAAQKPTNQLATPK
jgi:V8-like Glu-specific endopeptidase